MDRSVGRNGGHGFRGLLLGSPASLADPNHRRGAEDRRLVARMTVAFEFGFGRTVAKQSWEELLDDDNLAEGGTWPLVLAWIGLGPAVVRELQAR